MDDDQLDRLTRVPLDLLDNPLIGCYSTQPIVTETFTDPLWKQDKWHTQANGVQILLTEMKPRHRGNTLRLWERKVTTKAGLELLRQQPIYRKMIELGIE